MRLSSCVVALVASIAPAYAQILVTELSFGYGSRINPDGGNTIPHFSVQGNPGIPELLSNKLILTPPAPGNQRGAVWSDKPIQRKDWIVDVEFRANGPERGGGNLNIWVARDGAHEIGSASIYTVSKFEGLGIVIDGHGGYGGMLRAFLNDGSTDYRQGQQVVDGLSFGHCNLNYRNLGRPTQIKLRHSDAKGLRVEVDGGLCFESDKVRIPEGYRLGITAASADNPDSFEVFKLVTLTEQEDHPYSGSAQAQQQRSDGQQAVDGNSGLFGSGQGINAGAAGEKRTGQEQVKWDDDIPDASADRYTSSKAQFEDLHNRIQSINHHLSTVFRSLANSVSVGEKRHEETSIMLGELKGMLGSGVVDKMNTITALEAKINSLEREVRSMRNELTQKMRESEHAVKTVVSERHETLKEHIKDVAPGHTKLILFIVGSQLLSAGAYLLYKRRKSSPRSISKRLTSGER